MRESYLSLVVSVAAAAMALGSGIRVLAAEASDSGCAVAYTVSSQWKDGFVADLTVTNQGHALNGWQLSWSLDQGERVVQAWGAVATQSGTAVTVTNVSWNGALGQGDSARLGLVGSGLGSANPVPGSVALNGVTCIAVTGTSPVGSPAATVTPAAPAAPAVAATATSAATAVSPTVTPEATATPTDTPEATATPTVTPEATATPTVTPEAPAAPTVSPTVVPTVTATPPATDPATTPPAVTPTSTVAPAPTPSGSSGCGRVAGSAPVTKITEVNLGSAVIGFGAQGDTDPLPTAIAPAADGGSWLAWLGTDARVRVGKLDCDDTLVGSPTVVDGIDLQDIKADADGFVVLLTRKGDCGDTPLCGGTSSPCNTMHLVRFDNSGRQLWERQVTNLSSTLQGYDNGARFVWWYNHHGELAYDGTNYAAYFGVAITVANGDCVDVHEGDRMQVVDASSGALVPGHDSFEVGCSHSWDDHIAWDSRIGHFAMVCATDNGCRIARPDPYRTVVPGICDGTLFGGDIVPAGTAGYWTAWSQGNQVRLEHFSTGGSDQSVTTANTTQHSHLAGYGTGRMLLTWKSGAATTVQVYDSSTGQAVGSRFTIGVPDHPYVVTADYPDGSVAVPAAGTSSSAIRIARLMPLS
jgi:hypothetical protein